MNPDGMDDRESQLEGHIRALTARVYRLEETIERLRPGLLEENAETLPPSNAQSVAHPNHSLNSFGVPLESGVPLMPDASLEASEVARAVSSSAPEAKHVKTDRSSDTRSLENRIGSQWFNRIGILAMLIGMAWFLKLAIENQWVGPLGRVLIGLIAGAGLIGWSERFQRKGYPAFSYSLKALGSGVLYLSLWAAFSLYQLIPSWVAFAAMILITAFNAFLSWKQDAELLALYAIAGGLTTPLLLSTGGNHEVALLTYLLMLDLAVLTLVVARPWSRLLFVSFAGSAAFFAGWWLEFYSTDQLTRTTVFLSSFFLIFALAPRLVRIGFTEANRDSPKSLWDNLALVVLPIADAALGFVGYYILFDGVNHEWAGALVAVAMAAFYLTLIRFPHRGVMRASTALVTSLHLTVAIVFLTIAIPLKAHGRWLTIGWLAEGAALLWLSNQRQSKLLRVLGLLCLILGLGALVSIDPTVSETPFFNARFATYLIGIAVFAFVAWAENVESKREEANSSKANRRSLYDRQIGAAIAILIVNALILVALSLEIHSFWQIQSVAREWGSKPAHEMYAQFSYSALFMAFGTVLLLIGFARRSAFVRWQALVLLAAAIGKVFLMDVSKLSQGYRIVSFIGLGALLLGVSFVYQRDWLRLREPARNLPDGHEMEKPQT